MNNHRTCEVLSAMVAESIIGKGLRAKLRAFGAGAVVWSTAAKPDRVYQLRSGRVSIVSSDTRGNEILLRAVRPGELFGELCFCSHADEPHFTTAIATSRSEILEASYEDFRQAIQSDVEMATFVLTLLCTRLAEADQRVEILAERNARQRLKRLLTYVATFAGRPVKGRTSEMSVSMTHAQLAALGGLSRPHLTLLMTEFRERGLVSYKRGSALRIHVEKLGAFV